MTSWSRCRASSIATLAWWREALEPMFGAPDPMRLNDDVISCVGFVGYRERLAGGNTTLTPAGTVFFVTYPIDSSIPQHSATYAITAKHVIEKIARCSCDGRPYFR